MGRILCLFLSTTIILSCSEHKNETGMREHADSSEVSDVYRIGITELSDAEYPNNPDLGNLTSNYHSLSHDSLIIVKNTDATFRLVIMPANLESDTIVFDSLNLYTYIPALPIWVKQDSFLTNFGFTNSEWNRHQVRFDRSKGFFSINGGNYESKMITRIDIARNCLNSGLWELIFYAEEEGHNKPCYHGWFSFPEPLYAQMFEDVNGESFSKYRNRMAEWKTPEKERINLHVLRTVKSENALEFSSLNDRMYPKTGARKSKWKNIIYPENAKSINDFLTDSTSFATFAPPGVYTKADPRRTRLSLLAKPKSIIHRTVVQEKSDSLVELNEFEIKFLDKSGTEVSYIIIGGFSWDQIPTLSLEENNKGFKMPMGIANHAFYESYETSVAKPSIKNTYYGLLVDKEMKCLDSHEIGIDGPLIFWDANDEGLLHIMLLSFERHAFVGHFTCRPKG